MKFDGKEKIALGEVDEELDDTYERNCWEELVDNLTKTKVCPICESTNIKKRYNDHMGAYYTYDTYCGACGYVIVSLLD